MLVSNCKDYFDWQGQAPIHNKPKRTSLIVLGGGGQVEPCEKTFSEKSPCSHYNNNNIAKTNIPVFSNLKVRPLL